MLKETLEDNISLNIDTKGDMEQNLHSKQRDPWLDVLKAIAMLGVILVHFNGAWNSPISVISKVSKTGARCPQLFFIISAFLTWKGLEGRDTEWLMFYKKRWIRIAPVFYFAIVLSALVPVLRFHEISAGNWLSHFAFLNGFIPAWTNSIMNVEWYIADLAIFYLITPLLNKLIADLKSSLLVLLTAAILSTVSLIVYNEIGGSQVTAVRMYFETFFILHQLPVMVLGIVLYYLVRENDQKKLRKMLILGGVIVFAICVAFIAFHLNKRFITSSFIAGLIFAWIVLFCYTNKSIFDSKRWKTLSFIGVHSFGIYCFHQIIINCIMAFNPHGGIVIWLGTLILVIGLSVSIGFGAETIQKEWQKP